MLRQDRLGCLSELLRVGAVCLNADPASIFLSRPFERPNQLQFFALCRASGGVVCDFFEEMRGNGLFVSCFTGGFYPASVLFAQV